MRYAVAEVRPRPRPRRRVVVGIAMAVALAVGVLAGRAIAVRHDLPASPAPTRSVAAAAGSHEVPEAVFAAQPPFTGPAVTKFGQAAVQAAYRQAVNFALDTGWIPRLIGTRRSALTASDFAAPRATLTPTCAKAYDALVAKALTGDSAAIRELESATLFSVAGRNDVRALAGADAVTDRRFTRPVVAVDTSGGKQRLSISFTAKAVVHLRNAAGAQSTMQTARAVRYLLVPNPATNIKGRAFLIDAWSNHLQTGTARAA